MVPAVEAGFPQREIAESAYRFQQEVDRHARLIVGVNTYASDADIPVPTLQIDEQLGVQRAEEVRALKRRRDPGRVARSLDRLRQAATGTDNTMPCLIEAARAYATVGEMCDALREVWGEYHEAPVI